MSVEAYHLVYHFKETLGGQFGHHHASACCLEAFGAGFGTEHAHLAVGTLMGLQSLEGLRQTCPTHSGDWYFSGDYPTPGGLRMLKEAYIRYYESR